MTIIPIKTAVEIPYKAIETFCKTHHIDGFSLFGVVLDDKMPPDAHVDVLVLFDPRHPVGREFPALTEQLTEIFSRPVNLYTPESLPEHILQHVMLTSRMIYYPDWR